MGIKSSVVYTREQAETAYVQMRLNGKRAKYERKAKKLSNKELENQLEEMSDEEYNRENNSTSGGFNNYVIGE